MGHFSLRYLRWLYRFHYAIPTIVRFPHTHTPCVPIFCSFITRQSVPWLAAFSRFFLFFGSPDLSDFRWPDREQTLLPRSSTLPSHLDLRTSVHHVFACGFFVERISTGNATHSILYKYITMFFLLILLFLMRIRCWA